MKLFKILMVMGVLAFGTASNANNFVIEPAIAPDFNLDFVGLSGGDLTGGEGELGLWAIGEDIDITLLQISGAVGMVDGDVRTALITDGKLNFNTDSSTFVITGAVTDLQIDDVTTVLFSSTLYDWTFAAGFMDVFTADGTGLAGLALLTALGEPADANPFAFGGFSMESANGVLNSTDFLATSAGTRTPEVPIPAAAWLFGSGLLGLVGVARRKV